jgi:hypothetical protein
VRKFRKLSSFSSAHVFFAAENPTYFALAEQFVTLFVHSRMLCLEWQPLRNFSAAEKCALIARQGGVDCGLSQEYVQRLHDLRKPLDDLDGIWLRPIDQTLERRSLSMEDLFSSPVTEIEELHHIVLEIRKLPLQLSPSLTLCCLANVMQWLRDSIKDCAGHGVGADEVFQFFVFCLSVAKLWCLPALVQFVDHFVDEALRETKFNYYIEQLRSSLEFIDSRPLPVQPFVVFPFTRPPRRLDQIVRPTDAPPVMMKGFEVYAMPTWSRASEELFPAMIQYCGKSDVAKCYQFQVLDALKLTPDLALEAVPTLSGTFLQLSNELIKRHRMIRVEDGDYIAHLRQVATVSAMIEMAGQEVVNPSVGTMNKLFGKIFKMWKLNAAEDPVPQIQIIILDVQKALAHLDWVPTGLTFNGTLDVTTYEAVRAYWEKLPKIASTPGFPFAPRVLKAIRDTAKRHKS